MSTKSEVVYQRALRFKQLVTEISIKHYEHERYVEIVKQIFEDVFRDEIHEDEWNGDKERRDEGRDRRDDYNDNCTPM
jgi:hypothetical protein